MEITQELPHSHIYFLGIGGISMSGLAEILLSKGYKISGSDIKESNNTEHLRKLGIPINIGHKKENITSGIDILVYTAAVKETNPEIIKARSRNIKIIDRAELLGAVMKKYENSVAVSGTHGKTTTTSMVSEILLLSNTDPTISIGGILPSIGGNTRVGKSGYFVAEACEYFDSFLKFNPFVSVILNVEADHLDYFKDLKHIESSFKSFAQKTSENGYLVINSEIPCLNYIIENLKCTVVTFGLENSSADWSANNIVHETSGGSSFDVSFKGDLKGRIYLNIPGDHNIKNALAACAASYSLGIPINNISDGLKNYHGANRRFQIKGQFAGVTVVDDYAHHPSEIKATLKAAKNVNHKKIWCVFQPHTFSRTRFLFDDFTNAFFNADNVIIADIYAARENDTGEINSSILADKIKENGINAQYIGSFEQIANYLLQNCQQGDMLITMGAGDVYLIGESLVQA